MYDHVPTCHGCAVAHLLQGVQQLGPVRLLGLATLGPPLRLGTCDEIDLLVVADPLPGRRERRARLETRGGLCLTLRWKSVESLPYPSPLYRQIARRGVVLYDPHGLLATTLARLGAAT